MYKKLNKRQQEREEMEEVVERTNVYNNPIYENNIKYLSEPSSTDL